MLIVPLQPVPNQALTIILDGQYCQINVYQEPAALFVDLYKDNALVVAGAIAENLNRIIRSVYLGFSGDLAFIDNEGNTDPYYTGLGSRYSLAYITAAEIAAAN